MPPSLLNAQSNSQDPNAHQTASLLRLKIDNSISYTDAQSLVRARTLLRATHRSKSRIKVAVLGDATTKHLAQLIDLHLFSFDIDAEIYESSYGLFRQEILDCSSALHTFQPQIVILATTFRTLAYRPRPTDSETDVERLLEKEYLEWSELWRFANEKLSCSIIQDNFVLPSARPYSNLERKHIPSFGRYVTQINAHFLRRAPHFVTIHDVDDIASLQGRQRWQDNRFYFQAKMPCSPEFLVDYAHSHASLIAAHLGSVKKCIVVDLDNTLWGGVIGDDGLSGIKIGQGDPEGEAFSDFQLYLRSLRMRGVLLAVCSKNNAATAMEPFEKHPEMTLRLPDVACFVANWDDKATNIRQIAQTLNIGLDSLVFIDDNPAERAIVRQLTPEVAVPELPDDVSGYIHAIDRQRYFQVLSVGAEDMQRTELYHANSLRQAAASTTGSITAFLESLEMRASIRPVSTMTLDRCAQLIQRSNQFNLTTRRHSAADLASIVQNTDWITATVSLIDRFGDNGLVSVLLARRFETTIDIDTWLMSCRVLKRGVEHALLNSLVQAAMKAGASAIRGTYIPSAKNSLVKDHYPDLGFTLVAQEPNGTSLWELVLKDSWRPLQHYITETHER